MLEEDLGSANSVKGNLVDTSPSLSPHNLLNMTQNSHVPNLSGPHNKLLAQTLDLET